ncbi:hypothetical protein [Kitasatospora sp. NBC_00039]|uniref:hypothetical protein n=1 Tax=Kitasatospora sp. NBC_00039 TaxID=2903565 RepID=UPI00324FAFA9
MGESPDRVLRDGDRAREQDGERGGERERPAGGDGVQETAASAVPADAAAADAADTADAADAADVSDAADAADAADLADAAADAADLADAAADAADGAPVEVPSGTATAGSTVQLRVRDVDTKTTMIRLPVDNATTALRLPPELTAPAPKRDEAAADGGSGDAADRSPTKGEEPAGATGRSSRPDPRLALRTAAPTEQPVDDEEPAKAEKPIEKPGEKPAETQPGKPVETQPGKPVERQSGKPEPEQAKAEKLEKPLSAKAAAALPAAPGSGAGTVPKPVPEPHPEPAPLPEPEPTPEPLPKPAPAPKPGPAPAPEPLPTPDPKPLPPAPPLPKPEPLPAPDAPRPDAPRNPEAATTEPLAGPDLLSLTQPMLGPATTAEAMDVLAALNARPVSPLRRALKRITIWTVFLTVVLGAVVVAQLLRPLPDTKVKMTASGSFSFGGDPLDLAWPAKGQSAAEVVGVGSLGSSGPETPASIASVTKVMNAYLILQSHPLKKGESGPKITIDKQAAQESGNTDESRVTLTEGQQLTQYQALELLMLPSANNVARLLARWDVGSEDAFVKKMNDAAAKFGMANTVYIDPAGFSPDTKSTAKDQLKLAEQAMQDEIFRQIVSTPDTTFNGQKIYNTNTLINAKTGVIGVKTGSSTPAGGCLMWAAYKEIGGVKRLILGVTLGQPATSPAVTDGILPTVLKVSGKQIQAAQNGVTGQTLAKQGDVVGRVDNGLGGTVPVVAGKDLTAAGFPGITGTLTLDPAKLGHQAKAGTQVGTLSVGAGDNRTEVPVLLKSDLAPPSILSRITRLL